MAHTIEPAATGRSKCRGCGEKIAGGDLRFGESVPNPFAEGDTFHWFHLDCGAYKRPEAFLETLEGRAAGEALPDQERLTREAKLAVDHPRLARVDGAERASSGKAQCRSCRTPIAKDAWRIRLVFYEDGRFSPAGFLHVPCAAPYFETTEVTPRVRRFSPTLTEDDLREIQDELAKPAPPPAAPA
jgi:hypothetical protein